MSCTYTEGSVESSLSTWYWCWCQYRRRYWPWCPRCARGLVILYLIPFLRWLACRSASKYSLVESCEDLKQGDYDLGISRCSLSRDFILCSCLLHILFAIALSSAALFAIILFAIALFRLHSFLSYISCYCTLCFCTLCFCTLCFYILSITIIALALFAITLFSVLHIFNCALSSQSGYVPSRSCFSPRHSFRILR